MVAQMLWIGCVGGVEDTVENQRVVIPEQEAWRSLRVQGKEKVSSRWMEIGRMQVAQVVLVSESCSTEAKASCPKR